MRFARHATANGPILFLKNDRLAGTGWTQFATSLGLSVTDAALPLAEIGFVGTPILFIDGIDRVRPDRQEIITDLVNAIHGKPCRLVQVSPAGNSANTRRIMPFVGTNRLAV